MKSVGEATSTVLIINIISIIFYATFSTVAQKTRLSISTDLHLPDEVQVGVVDDDVARLHLPEQAGQGEGVRVVLATRGGGGLGVELESI